VPNNGVEVIETDFSTHHTNIGMQRKYQMPAETTPCNTYVPYHTNQPSSWNEYAEYMQPYLLELTEKNFIILDVPHLIRYVIIPFEVPIRRGCNNEMYRFMRNERQVPGVSVN
jgi:hypothetical protein